MRLLVLLLFTCLYNFGQAQLLTWTPEFAADNGSVTITVDANFGNQGLLGHTGNVYIHTGVITNLSATPSSWRYVAFNQDFTQENPALQATPAGANRWTFTINNIRTFYNVPGSETILKIALLFRSSNGSRVQRNADGSDMYIPLPGPGLNVRVTKPAREPKFIPTIQLCQQVNDVLQLEGKSSANASLKLYFNGTQIAATPNGTTVAANATITAPGLQRIVVEATPLASTTYRFTGNGNWSDAANWQGNLVPPTTIPAGTEVVIQPSVGGQATLNQSISFAPGSQLTVAANAIFNVPGNISIDGGEAQGLTPVRDTIEFFVAGPTPVEPLPAGVANNGVTYHNGGTAATLVLYAPNKNNIVVIGDFNNWTPNTNYQMKRTPDGLRYWIRLEGLTPGEEYAYQYQIDCNLKVADYNTEKVLDPWNDPWINQAPYTNRYPNLKPYPTGKATGIVSVLQPGKPTYNWQHTNFARPDKRNLMVYELLVRDFDVNNSFQTVIDSLPYLAGLGINAIHFMPFNEFEGNNSWGYNPSFMFATDKFYGPENKLKELIDSCHGRGIAVIMDMVLNHQFGQSPLIQMYWDAANNRPAANNPWANPVAKHGFNVGYDLNHEAPATIEFVERVMRHWLTEYKIDGFRWDLSKGFTQRQTCDNNGNNCNTGAWSAFDQSRVDIWQRIYNQSQAISPNAYMILEHLGDDDEEAILARIGCLLWGKMTDQYNQASMGYETNSNFGRAFHTTRWSFADPNFYAGDKPHLMAYAESHDEERLAWKNVRFGAAGTTNTAQYTRRLQAVAAFLLTTPGPKLLWQFGELAYDSSINMCENLLIGDCRTAPKPPAWRMPGATVGTFQNYNTITSRVALRNMYTRLLNLRTKNPEFMNTFTTNNVDFNLGGLVKSQRIQSNDLRIIVIGNFGTGALSGSVTFPVAGNWTLYAHNVPAGPPTNFTNMNPGLSSSGITIANNNQLVTFSNMPAGTFLLFTDRPVPNQ